MSSQRAVSLCGRQSGTPASAASSMLDAGERSEPLRERFFAFMDSFVLQ